MRTVLFLFLVGAMTMTAVADAQEKKDEKKDDGPKAPFTERVTANYWHENGKKFLNTHKDIDAYPYVSKKDKKDCWGIRSGGSHNIANGLTPKSEIISTDKDGNTTTWVVVRRINNAPLEGVYHVEVTKKE